MDLRPKLFNFRLNINNLATACQTPPSYSWCQIIQWQGILIYFKVFIIIYYYLYYLRCFFFVVVVVLLILFEQAQRIKEKKTEIEKGIKDLFRETTINKKNKGNSFLKKKKLSFIFLVHDWRIPGRFGSQKSLGTLSVLGATEIDSSYWSISNYILFFNRFFLKKKEKLLLLLSPRNIRQKRWSMVIF